MSWVFAYCEDEPNARGILAEQLKKWALTSEREVVLHCFEDADRLLGAWKDTETFDALFLDIELPGLDGMSLAESIRRQDRDIPLVFITNHSYIMPKGFAVEAIDFIVKPLDEAQLFAALDRVAYRLDNRIETFFTCRVERENVRVPVREIYYFISEGHYTYINDDPDYRFREKMDDLFERLPKRFVRIHRSIIVNMDHIHSYNSSRIVLDNEEHGEHPIGKNYLESFIKAISEYRRFF